MILLDDTFRVNVLKLFKNILFHLQIYLLNSNIASVRLFFLIDMTILLLIRVFCCKMYKYLHWIINQKRGQRALLSGGVLVRLGSFLAVNDKNLLFNDKKIL